MKINSKELKKIIKEGAKRLEKKMMLEAEKDSILKKIQEINEHFTQIEPEAKSIVDTNVHDILGKMNPQKIKKVKDELFAAGLLGASEQQIAHIVSEIIPMNESMDGESWTKSKIHNLLIGSGLGPTLSGLIIIAISSLGAQDITGLIIEAIRAISAGIEKL